MFSSNQQPWDCLDTFGKNFWTKAPGQAHLYQWPLKISMLPASAPYFHRAKLLLAADCSAFSYSHFHKSLLQDRILVTICPSMEPGFAQKLCDILRINDILSISVVRMDAPCCRPLTNAVMEAIHICGKSVPIQFTTIFAEGEIVDEEVLP